MGFARGDLDGCVFLEERCWLNTYELLPVVRAKIAVRKIFRARVPAYQLYVPAGGYRYRPAKSRIENGKFALLDGEHMIVFGVEHKIPCPHGIGDACLAGIAETASVHTSHCHRIAVTYEKIRMEPFRYLKRKRA